jgi:hypothetical protein
MLSFMPLPTRELISSLREAELRDPIALDLSGKRPPSYLGRTKRNPRSIRRLSRLEVHDPVRAQDGPSSVQMETFARDVLETDVTELYQLLHSLPPGRRLPSPRRPEPQHARDGAAQLRQPVGHPRPGPELEEGCAGRERSPGRKGRRPAGQGEGRSEDPKRLKPHTTAVPQLFEPLPNPQTLAAAVTKRPVLESEVSAGLRKTTEWVRSLEERLQEELQREVRAGARVEQQCQARLRVRVAA